MKGWVNVPQKEQHLGHTHFFTSFTPTVVPLNGVLRNMFYRYAGNCPLIPSHMFINALAVELPPC